MTQQSITAFAGRTTELAKADDAADSNDDSGADTAAEKLAQLSEEVAELRDEIGRAEEMDTDELAEIEAGLKALEDDVEECRKEEVEPTLDERLDVGDTAGAVRRVEGHNKFVFDADDTLNALEEVGVNPLSVCKPNASDVADALDEHDLDVSNHVGEATYTYYRRT